MVTRYETHCGDETCPSCVQAGDFLFLAHHAGGFEQDDAAYQMEKTLEMAAHTLRQAGAALTDLVQVTLWLKHREDFDRVREVWHRFFPNGAFPARMTAFTEFLSPACLCMIDGVAYYPQQEKNTSSENAESKTGENGRVSA